MITITETAANKIKQQLEKRKRGLGVRVGVKTTGCSGLAYTLEYVDESSNSEHDNLFEEHGVKVFIDAKSLVYLNGSTMDYLKKGLNEGFEFINPNEKDRCGCGESFTV